ncbi:MAG: hypothetical protein Q4B21_04115 [Bacteroidia bacterium]|nr:hypothetical protein [Bacteroidia bacterium]
MRTNWEIKESRKLSSSERLKAWKEQQAGLTYEKIAEKFGDITADSLKRAFSQGISEDIAERFEKHYDISADYILCKSDYMNKAEEKKYSIENKQMKLDAFKLFIESMNYTFDSESLDEHGKLKNNEQLAIEEKKIGNNMWLTDYMTEYSIYDSTGKKHNIDVRTLDNFLKSLEGQIEYMIID